VISSPANATIKRIRALRHRRERERTGTFYVEGIRLVGDAAEAGADVETCIIAPELLSSEFGGATAGRLTEHGAARLDVSAGVFRSLSEKEGPQGIAAVVRQRWAALDAIRPGEELCWIALDAVQDPGNLGTILRTSDAVGAAGVILLGGTDPFDPGTVRASMGAIFWQRLVRASPGALRVWKDRHGVLAAGTSDAASQDYREIDYRHPLLLVMGSEREGLSADAQGLCDVTARIPMVGHSDSLNLAVATGVMLYEIFDRLH
jgi:TrmH family RNA methyltransferase